MGKINQIGFSEISKIKNLVSLICGDDIANCQNFLLGSVYSTFFQNFLPLCLRVFPETFVFHSDDELKGVISVVTQKGNFTKLDIARLFLKKNSFEAGKQLVDHIVSHFGQIGVKTFFAEVDDYQKELIELFVKGSKFRMCSCIGLHRVTNVNFISDKENSGFKFRKFNNSDALDVASLFNENIFPVFKNSLSKEKREFREDNCSPSGETVFKYVSELKNGQIISYIEITTSDNLSYIVDIVLSQGYSGLYPQILTSAIRQILNRQHSKLIYLKNRKYLVSGHEIEQFFRENHFEMLQNRVVLVKDFYKTVRSKSMFSAEGIGEILSNTAFGYREVKMEGAQPDRLSQESRKTS